MNNQMKLVNKITLLSTQIGMALACYEMAKSVYYAPNYMVIDSDASMEAFVGGLLLFVGMGIISMIAMAIELKIMKEER